MNELFYGVWTQGNLQSIAPIANIIMTAVNWVVSLAGLLGVGFGVIRVVADIICIMSPNGVESIRQAKMEVANQVKAVGDKTAVAQVGGVLQGIISHLPDFYSISSFHGKDGQVEQIPSLGAYLTSRFPGICAIVVILVLIYGGYLTKIYGMVGNGAKWGLDFVLQNANPEQIVTSLANGAGNYVIGSSKEQVRVSTEKAMSAVFTRFPDIPATDRQSVVSTIASSLEGSSIGTGNPYDGAYSVSATAYVTKVKVDDSVISASNQASESRKNNGSYQTMVQFNLHDGNFQTAIKNSVTANNAEWGNNAYLVVTATYTKSNNYQWIENGTTNTNNNSNRNNGGNTIETR